MIEHYVKTYYSEEARQGEEYRREEIWQLDVNDVLFANLSALKKLYNMFQQRNLDKTFSLNSARHLLEKDYGLPDKDLIHCFALSKMLIVPDSDKQLYLKLSFVEFLDFTCRIS